MARDHIGLFDTPPDRQVIRFGLLIIFLLFAALIAILPERHIPLGEFAAFVPSIDAVMFVCELIVGTLLYAQAALFRSRALSILASGYVLAALLLVPHALSFPGAFAATGVIGGGINSTAWLAIWRRLAFPIAVLLYALLKQAGPAARPGAEGSARPLTGLLGAIALAGLATFLAIEGHDLLPAIFVNQRDAIPASLIVLGVATMAPTLGAMALLFRKGMSVLDLWLLVALSAWLFQSLLNLTLRARFTLGWYGLYGMMMIASLIVTIALIAECHRLYARLALSTAVRNVEREARLTSMDAVAAAFSHEVGQPIAAIALNASVAMTWLTRPKPQVEKAIESVRAIIESAERSFGIMRSVRSIVAKGPPGTVEFSFNDMVRETAALLEGDLADSRISLQLSLDEGVPPVVANRIQLQQVLINLIRNAMESVVSVRGRPRRIWIRSRLEGEKLLFEVGDEGAGIPPEVMPNIFAPFHTTKATGTGIGLSLCRSIVEDHGGRIWASQGDPHGAAFHVQIPHRNRGMAAPDI